MTVAVSDKKIDLDEVLNDYGIFQLYHVRLGLLVIFGAITNSMFCANYIFVVEDVKYRCIDQNISNVCSDCKEWIYDNPDSFVAEFQLACQDWKRALVGTTHSLGYMCGLLIVGPLSDRFGRKTLAIITGTLGGVIGIMRSFSTWYWLYIVLEFLEAAIGDSCLPMFVLTLEYVSKQKRVPYSCICNTGYAMGGALLALSAWLVPYWRSLLRCIYTPALFFMFYTILLDESPRWLHIKNQNDKAADLLVKIAKTNGKKLNKDDLEKLSWETEPSVPLAELLKNTFKSRQLRTRFIVCFIWWCTCTFVSYGATINSVLLQGNKYVNYAMMSLLEITALFGCMYVLKYYKRKYPLMATFYVAAAFFIIQPFMPTNLPWLSIAIFMAAKAMTSFYFNITYIYTSELFPTYTRNSMHALCSSLGRVGSIIAPQTPLLRAYWFGLPSIIFGLAALVAGSVTFLVPDTDSTSLPDTVHQAEALGKPKDEVKSAKGAEITSRL